MILVCPSCDAKFKIPDGAIPSGGRTVRCAKCKNSWHAEAADIMRKPVAAKVARAPGSMAASGPRPPSEAVSFDGELDAKAASDAAALRRSVRGTAAVDEPSEEAVEEDNPFDEEGHGGPDAMDTENDSDDFGVTAALKKSFGENFEEEYKDEIASDGNVGLNEDGEEDEEYDEDDFLGRRRADQRRQSERQSLGRMRKLMTFGLGGLIVFWLLVFYVFMFQQENMRYYFPGTSSVVYGFFGGLDDRERFRPVEGETLTKSPALAEEYVRALLLPPPNGLTVETRSGQQGLMLRGFVENAGTTGANVPEVQAFIQDANGNVLDSWTFKPLGLILRRGGKVNFEEFRTPIPAGANKAEVRVIEGSKASRDARDDEKYKKR